MSDKLEVKVRKLEKKVKKLETIVEDYMERWGPGVQERRDERDRRWDQMVKVLQIQERNTSKKRI